MTTTSQSKILASMDALLIGASNNLHKTADNIIYALETRHADLLAADTAEGDNARNTLECARKWRAVCEGN